MADTPKSKSANLSDWADNHTGDITPQIGRNLIESIIGFTVDTETTPSNPSTGLGLLYCMTIDSELELFYINEDNNIQLTRHGSNNITLNITEPETDITLTVDNNIVLCDASSGNIDVTLPEVGISAGKTFYIKKIDSSNNMVSIIGSDDDSLIDGGEFAAVSDQWECITIVSNGTNWYIL